MIDYFESKLSKIVCLRELLGIEVKIFSNFIGAD